MGFPPPRMVTVGGRGARRSNWRPGGPAPGRTDAAQAAPMETTSLVGKPSGEDRDDSSSSSSSSSSSKPTAQEAVTATPVDALDAFIAPRTPPDPAPVELPVSPLLVTPPAPAAPDVGTPGHEQLAINATVPDTAAAAAAIAGAPTPASAPVALSAAAGEEAPDEELRPIRPPPKPGKISFNIQGGAMAKAQAQVQVEEAVAAARARRLNFKDASTQTVRDPEQEGDIVCLLRLRPRGMESFPHFPRPGKKKAKEPTICAIAEADEAVPAVTDASSDPQKLGRKRSHADGPGAVEEGSEGPDGAVTTIDVEEGAAGDAEEEAPTMALPVEPIAAETTDEDDEDSSEEEDGDSSDSFQDDEIVQALKPGSPKAAPKAAVAERDL
mmetsp:Transcript_149617/g.259921  ORF Transcript_149617/g.259921 Transcript_149617/m.259921 type:complete len:383 (+) Transcript_149617:3-1151(+)